LEADLNWLLGALAQAQEAKLNAELNTMLGLTSEMDSQEEGGASGFDSPQYGPDDLWLEINGPPVGGSANLTAHGTIPFDLYQILTKTNLLERDWTPDLIFGGAADTNRTDNISVNVNDNPQMFFWAEHSSNVVEIAWVQDAVEPTTVTSLKDGIFKVFIEPGGDGPVTVTYRVSGTATEGADYTNLTHTVTVPAGDVGLIFIHPLADDEVEFEETVVVTLVPGSGYLVHPDPTRNTATLTITDFRFQLVTNVALPAGIDYDAYTNALIVSVNNDTSDTGGESNNFVRIFTSGTDTNGVGTNVVVEQWSNLHGLKDEVKLAVVQQTANGFTNGEMYFGTGVNGIVGKLSPDSLSANLSWAILDSNTNGLDTLIRGSLCVDQTGTFSNDLIAVTGGGFHEGGGVWRIHSPSNLVQLAKITNSFGQQVHLEGVTTITNNPAKWGQWAGKIIFGAESESPPLVLTIDTNGVVEAFDMGIAPEDFDLIPTNQDLYIAGQPDGPDQGALLKLSREFLKDFVGDLLIAQVGDGANHPEAKLFIVKWDSINSVPVIVGSISVPRNFEHVTFAPINLPAH
jgi:hypothetical protein